MNHMEQRDLRFSPLRSQPIRIQDYRSTVMKAGNLAHPVRSRFQFTVRHPPLLHCHIVEFQHGHRVMEEAEPLAAGGQFLPIGIQHLSEGEQDWLALGRLKDSLLKINSMNNSKFDSFIVNQCKLLKSFSEMV